MSLSSGTFLGPYEISSVLGVGGMGEVYRARDRKLGRDVAIKILPPAVAADPDRIARFEREARTLAALNHTNIAQVYGLEDASGVRALVMELVEGPTLADRIAQGRIPIADALPIARQIATALEAAHEQGIIHRDLKPANIKVRPDGAVKVLDFGLAKALEPAGAPPGATQSPTITSPAMLTGAGVLLGTAAYMSPEQARGKTLDKRTDIWSFGAVVYEMLSGVRAFPGEEVSDVLASVLAREPDWRMLPGGLPPILVSYLKRCLQKDRQQRIRDIGDVLLALDGAFDETAAAGETPSSLPQRAFPIAIAAALAAALVAALAAWRLWPSDEPQLISTFEYILPETQQLPGTQRPVVTIAPDGRSFVLQASDGLYLRSMAALDLRLIPGTTESLTSPFFSPEGRWVGYWASAGQLKKIDVRGGSPMIVCAAATPFGISWAADNTILFGQNAGIMRVSANGGTPQLVVRAAEGEQLYGPQLLPDGDSVLFSVTRDRGPSRWDQAQVAVQSLSSGKRTILVQAGSDARYLPTGQLFYALRGGVFGVPFDVKRLAVAGDPVPIAQGVQRAMGVLGAGWNYGISDRGTLVYLSGGGGALRSLVWVHRDGTVAGPIGPIPAGTYEDPRLSPDSTRVVVSRDGDVWVYDIASGRTTRLTRDGSSLMGVWDSTGSRVAYSSARKGNLEAWVQSADGSGEPRQLTQLGGQVHVDAWSPDGRTLTMHQHPLEGPANIFTLQMDRADRSPMCSSRPTSMQRAPTCRPTGITCRTCRKRPVNAKSTSGAIPTRPGR